MSIFKKPETREPKRTIMMMIYGTAGCGKTTLACSAPNAVLFDFEDGLHRVKHAHQIPSIHPAKWDDVMAAVDEICKTKEIESVVVDSVERLLDCALEQIRKTSPKDFMKDGTPGLRAYGSRKVLYENFVKRLRDTGKNIIYISHEVTKKEKVGNNEVLRTRPNIPESSLPLITNDLDMEGYMFKEQGEIRYISFDPWGDIECKNTISVHGPWDDKYKCYSPIVVPNVVDQASQTALANEFIKQLIDFNNNRINLEYGIAQEGGKA